jgi:tetratricopeptide (TPR) repeat protein
MGGFPSSHSDSEFDIEEFERRAGVVLWHENPFFAKAPESSYPSQNSSAIDQEAVLQEENLLWSSKEFDLLGNAKDFLLGIDVTEQRRGSQVKTVTLNPDSEIKIDEVKDTKEINKEIQISVISSKYPKIIKAYCKPMRPKCTSSKELNNRGCMLYNLRKFEDAMEFYDHAIHFDHLNPKAYNNKGVTLDDLERYDEALANYDQALQLLPTYAVAYNNKGFTLFNIGRFSEALACYERAIEIDPKIYKAINNKNYLIEEIGRNKKMRKKK